MTITPPSIAYALAVTPTAVGCALGILLGKVLKPRVGTITAIGLLTAGVACALPATVDYISKRINHPSTNRGKRRRLEGIRNGALPTEEFFEEEVSIPEQP